MQNNTYTKVYAGFFVRLAAFTVDNLILWILLIGIRFPMLMVAIFNPDNFLVKDFIFKYSLVDLLLISLNVLYYVILTYFTGATFGKMLFSIKVVSEDSDRRPTFGEILYRETVGRFLSSLMNIGYLVLLCDKEKRGIHDMLADTRVIYVHCEGAYKFRKKQKVNNTENSGNNKYNFGNGNSGNNSNAAQDGALPGFKREATLVPDKTPDVTNIPDGFTASSASDMQTSDNVANMPGFTIKDEGNQIPSQTANQMPSQVPNQTANQMPSQVPNQMPSQVPNQMPSQMPNQMPNQVSGQMTNQVTNQMPNQMSSQVPNQMPNQTSNQMPNQMSSQVPNQMPNQTSNQMEKNQTDIEKESQSMQSTAQSVEVTSTSVDPEEIYVSEEEYNKNPDLYIRTEYGKYIKK